MQLSKKNFSLNFTVVNTRRFKMNSEKKEQINGNNGHILNEKKTNFKEKKPSKIEFLEISANTVNHALIAITSFYITWYCYHEGFKEYQFFHGWFATIGYQLFMSEGIMAMYNRNSYTMFIEKRRSKVWVHLSLMVIGSGFALFAIPYQFIKREQLGKHHLDNKHAVFGKIIFATKKSKWNHFLLIFQDLYHCVYFASHSFLVSLPSLR